MYLRDQAVADVVGAASLDQVGYRRVVELHDNEAMKGFIIRVVNENGGLIDSDYQLAYIEGMAPWYSGQKGVNGFRLLLEELKGKTWALAPSGKKRALVHRLQHEQCNTTMDPLAQAQSVPLTELGYQCVAALADPAVMAHFITRVIFANGGSVTEAATADIMGMAHWYGGENGVQAFDTLMQELHVKPFALSKGNVHKPAVQAPAIIPAPPMAALNHTRADVLPLDPTTFFEYSPEFCDMRGDRRLWKWWRSRPDYGFNGAIDSSKTVIDEWLKDRPDGPIFYEDGSHSCLLHHPKEAAEAGTAVLTLVSKGSAPRCVSDGKNVNRTFRIKTFEVGGAMAAQGTVRNYAAVWPKEGVCAKAKCPLVVALHGAQEHGNPNDEEPFAGISRVGLLRQYLHDDSCASSLGSVLLFPQLKKNERWEWHGQRAFANFVVPLVRHVLELGANRVDPERVALVGYSEGAVGAIHGALRHPDIFSLVVAPSFTWGEWWELPWMNKQLLDGIPSADEFPKYRLKLVVLPLPEMQPSVLYGHSAKNLGVVLRLLKKFNASERIAVHARVMAGQSHVSNVDAVYNKWPDFHEVVWKGNWASSSTGRSIFALRRNVGSGLVPLASTNLSSMAALRSRSALTRVETVTDMAFYSARSMTLLHRQPQCDDREKAYWRDRGHVAQGIVDMWNSHRPMGQMFALNANEGCMVKKDPSAQGFFFNNFDQMLWKPQVMTLVHKSSAPICDKDASTFMWVTPQTIGVGGPLYDRNPFRNYAQLWPPRGTCHPDKPCPLVIFLSGIGEHTDAFNGDMNEFKRQFDPIHKFGFLRYAERDSHCLKHLGAILVFPEPDRHESWVKDGPELIEYMVLPIIRELKRQSPHSVDDGKVAIMGYSEGAFGALQAAMHYPDVFTFAVAASCSSGPGWWNEITRNFRNTTAPNKLQLVMFALGELDNTGDQGENMHHILSLLDTANTPKRAMVNARFYAGLYHKEVWERLFNQLPAFHDVFWRGLFDTFDANLPVSEQPLLASSEVSFGDALEVVDDGDGIAEVCSEHYHSNATVDLAAASEEKIANATADVVTKSGKLADEFSMPNITVVLTIENGVVEQVAIPNTTGRAEVSVESSAGSLTLLADRRSRVEASGESPLWKVNDGFAQTDLNSSRGQERKAAALKEEAEYLEQRATRAEEKARELDARIGQLRKELADLRAAKALEKAPDNATDKANASDSGESSHALESGALTGFIRTTKSHNDAHFSMQAHVTMEEYINFQRARELAQLQAQLADMRRNDSQVTAIQTNLTEANPLAPDFAIFSPVGRKACLGRVIYDGASNGPADCQKRCLNSTFCSHTSFWLDGGAHWCRLTATCASFESQSQHKMVIWERVKASVGFNHTMGPGHSICIGDNVTFEGPSEGQRDCQHICIRNASCTHASYWVTGGSGWCRATRGCHAFEPGPLNTIVVFEKVPGMQWTSHNAPLSETGYQYISQLNDNAEMKSYVRRVAQFHDKEVLDEGMLNGIVPFYSGEALVQDYEALRNELLRAPWTRTVVSEEAVTMLADSTALSLFREQVGENASREIVNVSVDVRISAIEGTVVGTNSTSNVSADEVAEAGGVANMSFRAAADMDMFSNSSVDEAAELNVTANASLATSATSNASLDEVAELNMAANASTDVNVSVGEAADLNLNASEAAELNVTANASLATNANANTSLDQSAEVNVSADANTSLGHVASLDGANAFSVTEGVNGSVVDGAVYVLDRSDLHEVSTNDSQDANVSEVHNLARKEMEYAAEVNFLAATEVSLAGERQDDGNFRSVQLLQRSTGRSTGVKKREAQSGMKILSGYAGRFVHFMSKLGSKLASEDPKSRFLSSKKRGHHHKVAAAGAISLATRVAKDGDNVSADDLGNTSADDSTDASLNDSANESVNFSVDASLNDSAIVLANETEFSANASNLSGPVPTLLKIRTENGTRTVMINLDIDEGLRPNMTLTLRFSSDGYTRCDIPLPVTTLPPRASNSTEAVTRPVANATNTSEGGCGGEGGSLCMQALANTTNTSGTDGSKGGCGGEGGSLCMQRAEGRLQNVVNPFAVLVGQMKKNGSFANDTLMRAFVRSFAKVLNTTLLSRGMLDNQTASAQDAIFQQLVDAGAVEENKFLEMIKVVKSNRTDSSEEGEGFLAIFSSLLNVTADKSQTMQEITTALNISRGEEAVDVQVPGSNQTALPLSERSLLSMHGGSELVRGATSLTGPLMEVSSSPQEAQVHEVHAQLPERSIQAAAVRNESDDLEGGAALEPLTALLVKPNAGYTLHPKEATSTALSEAQEARIHSFSFSEELDRMDDNPEVIEFLSDAFPEDDI